MLDSTTFHGEESVPTSHLNPFSEEEDPILAELWRARQELAQEYGNDHAFQSECYRRAAYLMGADVYAWTESEGLKLVHKGAGLLELDELKAMFAAVRATVRREMRGG